MQCTAQRQQKAANTSLLESRNLLQTATLVFPRPIVCSRHSNNINILAKKNFRPPTGGHAPRPRAGSATGLSNVIGSIYNCPKFDQVDQQKIPLNSVLVKFIRPPSTNFRSTLLFQSLSLHSYPLLSFISWNNDHSVFGSHWRR